MKLKEGFESRIAIGDLDAKVQEKIFARVFSKDKTFSFGKNDEERFKKIAELRKSLEDVFYDIDSFEVEIDSRGIGEIADALKEDVEDVAKSIEKILRLLPKSEVGQYENNNEQTMTTRRIKMFEEFSVDELEGFFLEDDEEDEDEDEDGKKKKKKYSTVDDMPHGGMEIEGEVEALEEEEDEDGKKKKKKYSTVDDMPHGGMEIEGEVEALEEEEDEPLEEGADPLEVTSKDEMRVNDIIKKSNGDKSKARQLAETMCKLIKDKYKALRRARAAENENYHEIANIFFKRAMELA